MNLQHVFALLLLSALLFASFIELPGEEWAIGLFETGKEFLLIAQEDENKQILLMHLDRSLKLSKLDRVANAKPDRINDALFLEKKNLFVLAGHSLDNLRRRSIYICLIDIHGELLKEQTIAFSGAESWAESIAFSNGSLFLAGGYNTLKRGWFDALLLRLSLNLTLEWRKTTGGLSDDWFNRVKLIDSHLLCLGSTESRGQGASDILIVLYDLKGKKIWERTFGGADWDKAVDCIEFKDRFFILGWTYSHTFHCSGLLIELRRDGKLVKERLIDLNSDFSPSGIVALKNHLLVYGAVWNDQTRFDPIFILLDEHGQVQKIHTLPWPNDQTVRGVLLEDGQIIFYGESGNEITNEDVYVHALSIESLLSSKE